MQPNLSFLINKSPEEIIRWFRSKGLRFSWDWGEIWQYAHNKAFTAAKVMRADILQDIKNAYIRSLEEGMTSREFQRVLEAKLRDAGWWGKVYAKDVPGYNNLSPKLRAKIDPYQVVQLGSVNRLRTIFETNNNVAYNVGRYNAQIENAINRPYLQYVQIQRPNKREEHSKLHLLVFRYDDPIIKIIYPPNGWGCGCRMRALSKQDLKRENLKVTRGKDVIPLLDLDPAWAYNPALQGFTPDLSKYDPEIADAFRKYQGAL